MSKINFNKGELAVLALYNLGGDSDLESIAIEVDKLGPGKFRWRSKADMISDLVVRDALYNVNKHKLGKMNNIINNRYILTEVGVKFAQDNIKNLPKNSNFDKRETKVDKDKKKLAYNRILNGDAFKHLSENRIDQIQKKDLEFILRVNDYMDKKKKSEKIQSLKKLFYEDSKILETINTFEKLYFNWEEK